MSLSRHLRTNCYHSRITFLSLSSLLSHSQHKHYPFTHHASTLPRPFPRPTDHKPPPLSLACYSHLIPCFHISPRTSLPPCHASLSYSNTVPLSPPCSCWIIDGNYNYILSAPVVISLLLNLFFLINIVRVLVTKLRAVNTAPDTHSTRKVSFGRFSVSKHYRQSGRSS